MFRQVVFHRWSPDATDDDRAGFARAVAALRGVPDVAAVEWGEDDTGIPDNHHGVTILDFPDLPAARRYVHAPEHKRFVHEFAIPFATDRAVVQYSWGRGAVTGLHHAKLPVTDVAASRDWYCRAFGFACEVEFREDGDVLRGVGLRHPASGLRLALREDPDRAEALAGFDAVCLAVGTRADLDELLARLELHGIGHTDPVAGHRGDAADVPDPDGHIIRIHTLG